MALETISKPHWGCFSAETCPVNIAFKKDFFSSIKRKLKKKKVFNLAQDVLCCQDEKSRLKSEILKVKKVCLR